MGVSFLFGEGRDDDPGLLGWCRLEARGCGLEEEWLAVAAVVEVGDLRGEVGVVTGCGWGVGVMGEVRGEVVGGSRVPLLLVEEGEGREAGM